MGHAFYEAASIRKINGKYYFIYSLKIAMNYAMLPVISDKILNMVELLFPMEMLVIKDEGTKTVII